MILKKLFAKYKVSGLIFLVLSRERLLKSLKKIVTNVAT